jgi:hypothetical protein
MNMKRISKTSKGKRYLESYGKTFEMKMKRDRYFSKKRGYEWSENRYIFKKLEEL